MAAAPAVVRPKLSKLALTTLPRLSQSILSQELPDPYWHAAYPWPYLVERNVLSGVTQLLAVELAKVLTVDNRFCQILRMACSVVTSGEV